MATSSSVRLVSAIALASTSLRVPERGRRERGALRGGVDLAMEAVEDDVGGQCAKRDGGALDFGHPGEEGEQRPGMLAQRALDRDRHLRLDPLDGVAAFVDQRQRIGLARAFDPRRVAEQPPEPLAVERRRHGEDPQIGAKRARGVERQRQPEVAVEAALVDLVEQHRRHAAEFGISLEPCQEHAVGHRDEPRRLADLAVEPGGITNARPRHLAAFARDIFGRGARGEAPRDEQQHLSVAPRLVEQRRRDARRLARARRRDQQRARSLAKRGEQGVQYAVDGQGVAHRVPRKVTRVERCFLEWSGRRCIGRLWQTGRDCDSRTTMRGPPPSVARGQARWSVIDQWLTPAQHRRRQMKAMKNQANPPAKRPYSSPTLTVHGTVTALTRNGIGSSPENGSSSKKKRP